MAAARAVLEKCTMMLLTASKVCVVCIVVPPTVLHATETQTFFLFFIFLYCTTLSPFPFFSLW